MLSKQLIRLRGHDEIIPAQAADFVRPPLDGNAPPLGHDQRVMSLLLGEGADSVGEFQRGDEVFEFEDSL